MLIHDALCDYIMCGDTSVLAYEFRAAVCAMHKMDGKGQSGFMRQFEVCVWVHNQMEGYAWRSLELIIYTYTVCLQILAGRLATVTETLMMTSLIGFGRRCSAARMGSYKQVRPSRGGNRERWSHCWPRSTHHL